MATHSDEIVGKGEFGEPVYVTDWKFMEFKFNGFENLTEKKKHETNVVLCHGRKWKLRVYPWGSSDEAKAEKQVSVFLKIDDLKSEESCKVQRRIFVAGCLVNT